MARTPSPQQKVVYEWVRDESGNLLLIARAGCGKTTTILNCAAIVAKFPTREIVAIVAYNRKIADESNEKLKGSNIGPRVRSMTFHSAGLSNWTRQYPKVVLDKKKVEKLITEVKAPEQLEKFILKLVSMGKQRAVGHLERIESPDTWWNIINHYDLEETLPADAGEYMNQLIEDGIGYAQTVYNKSINLDDTVIDYDDMILAPLVHECRVYKNDFVFVDEAQDTNPARRELAKKMCNPNGGRFIWVGDPAQAIYGFAGASNDALEIIKQEFQCKELPLSVTYRCPKTVVGFAQKYVPDITAHETAPEGLVTEMDAMLFSKVSPDLFTPDAAMLCRLTAPLVSQAFGLIRRGIPCHVEGKAIGNGLLNLINKWKTNSLDELLIKLDDYQTAEVKKLLEGGHEQKAEALADRIETVKVIIDALQADATVNTLRAQIKSLFGDTPEGERPKAFTLSTVHRSKGREWDTVYLLDRIKYMPSKYAKQDWQIQQEYNLIYVAITRAKQVLVEVSTK